MSSMQGILSAYAVPLQVWLTPEARKKAADPLLRALEGKALILTNPLATLTELSGPAVVVVAASELSGRRSEELRTLVSRAHPGRAVLIGGTSDRDTLMKGINDWGVVRVVPINAGADEIISAVQAAGLHLKREVALESAIEDLDLETTMLDSAIDHLDAGRAGALERARGNASNTFSEGLAAALSRESAVVSALPSDSPELEQAVQAINALSTLVQQAGDRATEQSAGLDPAPEDLDSVLTGFRHVWTAQYGSKLPGHIGTGAQTTVDPYALTMLLMQVAEVHGESRPISFDAHRAGSNAVVELGFSNPPDPGTLNLPEGVRIDTQGLEPTLLRLIITSVEPSHG